MGSQKLARELSIPLKEAKAFIERYFAKLVRLRTFYDEVEAQAKEQGFVITLAGRRRLLPEIHSRNNQLASAARRQAINTRIQGSAADIIKMAMLSVHGDATLREMGARLLLQVHDELVVEAPEPRARDAGARVAELMCAVGERAGLSVTHAVDWGAGRDWAEAH